MNIRELKVPGVNINSTFLKDGVHVASRPGLFCSIALFQVENFYVEIFYNKKTNEVGRVKTFHDMELLEPYLKQIDISALLN
jgi:hypothetical protein